MSSKYHKNDNYVMLKHLPKIYLAWKRGIMTFIGYFCVCAVVFHIFFTFYSTLDANSSFYFFYLIRILIASFILSIFSLFWQPWIRIWGLILGHFIIGAALLLPEEFALAPAVFAFGFIPVILSSYLKMGKIKDKLIVTMVEDIQKTMKKYQIKEFHLLEWKAWVILSGYLKGGKETESDYSLRLIEQISIKRLLKEGYSFDAWKNIIKYEINSAETN